MGYYTLLAASLVSRTGRVISFEPVPQNYALLERAVKDNQLTHVEIHNLAAWNKHDVIQISLNESPLFGSAIYKREGPEIAIEAVKLDEMLPSNPRVKLLKLDVEGAERQVLEGSQNLVRNRFIENIIIEWHQDTCQKGSFLESLLETYTFSRLTNEHYNSAWANPFAHRSLDLAELRSIQGNLLLRLKD